MNADSTDIPWFLRQRAQFVWLLSFARRICDAYSFALVATPTPIQAQAFSLLAVDPTKL